MRETVKVLLFDDNNDIVSVEVLVSRKFEYNGYTWVIHRSVHLDKSIKDDRWAVSEYQTGMRCLITKGKLAEVEEEAKKILDIHGMDRTEKAVELAIERHGIINKEDA